MNFYEERPGYWRVSHQWLQREADAGILREVKANHSGYNVAMGCYLVKREDLSDEIDNALEAECEKGKEEAER